MAQRKDKGSAARKRGIAAKAYSARHVKEANGLRPTSSTAKQLQAIRPTERLNLLSIPGEVRNEIYRLVLVVPQPRKIVVSQTSFAEPALLATCRQIRRESRPSYYKENSFSIVCENLDYTVELLFSKRRARLPMMDAHRLRYRNVSQGSWKNLLKGLKACYKRANQGQGIAGHDGTVWRCAARAFDIVKELRGSPWEVVAAVLESYRLGVTEQSGEMRRIWREM